MRKRWWAAGALASLGVLGGGTAAIAGVFDEPRVDQVEAGIVYTHASVDYRLCQGPQGPFRGGLVHVVGQSTGDASLTGDVTADLHYLWHDVTGEGYQRGTMVFRDPGTGRTTARADFVDAGMADIFQGTLVGSVKETGRMLVANWRTTWHENGAVTAEIGGEAADARLPAVTIGGSCTGPYTHMEEDFPPPDEPVAGAGQPSDGGGWSGR